MAWIYQIAGSSTHGVDLLDHRVIHAWRGSTGSPGHPRMAWIYWIAGSSTHGVDLPVDPRHAWVRWQIPAQDHAAAAPVRVP